MRFKRINRQIRAPKVHLIDTDGQSKGIFNLNQALELAAEKGQDLVEISANVFPPIAKIMDFGKYKYEQEKNLKKQKKLSKKGVETKEIRLSLNIDEHDLEFKKKRAQEFLEKNYKVRVFLKLMGREMRFMERARNLIDNFIQKTGGKIDLPIQRERNIFSAIISPEKK